MSTVKGNPADLLASAEVVATLVRVVRARGVPATEVSDAVARVQLRVLKSLRNRPTFAWPATLEEWRARAIRAAQSEMADQGKKNKTKKEYGDEGAVVESPDEHEGQGRHPSERDPIDQKLAMRILDEVIAESRKPALDREIAEHMAQGTGQVQIAQSLGLPYHTVHNRVLALQKAFRAKATAVAAGLLALSLFFYVRAPQPGPAPDLASTAPAASASVPAPAPGPTPEQLAKAATLRAQAQHACNVSLYDDCKRKLDEAKRLDPDGESTPELRALRQDAEEGYARLLKELEMQRNGVVKRVSPPSKPAPAASAAPKARTNP